ncbi:ATP-binding protein [Massilia sp. Dwa41.01b]|uniref:AAA family ATPase n=1 Tax=unclassified Massilia TaxID=2609279 RepID=UPI001600972B|nr:MULTISPECIES: ATP-binding protein [unclassified Massilia]QNA90286.1 ATP-binding protein [Massilia sp. Dwa41.01b]QNB01187.1 ATP-binding protein [Massilia sp. Se16.2.3]
MKTRRRIASQGFPSKEIDSITDLWMLRILVPLSGLKYFVMRNGFSEDTVARHLGVGDWLDNDELDFDKAAVCAQVRELHIAAEARAPGLLPPPALQANMARLSKLVGLSDVDCRILEFAALIHHDRVLDDCADILGQLNSLKVIDALAAILALDRRAVQAALATQGVLARSGLLAVDRGNGGFLRGKLDLLSDSFAALVMGEEADPLALLKDTVSPSLPATLCLADYAHIDASLALLKPYLQQALATGRVGVNIFLHGAPGTGKSELARAMAAALGCELFEVASEDDDGDPVLGERRLRAYRAAQSFFGQRNAMILFDEVEDVFNDGDRMFGRMSTAQKRKAWINRTLEQNAVPALWLSNSIDGIDPAFLRRFDMVIEMPVPPRSQRERIVRDACGGVLDDAAVRRIASSPRLAPAVVSRAAEVVRTIGSGFDADGTGSAGRAVEFLIDQSLQAQGHAPIRQGEAARLPAEYDAALVNADADMLQLADGLAGNRAARLCLYGPPGTGKTAYGRWLAERLDMPLLLYTASELISKWVGESEKNIAAAFRRAESENALLLIDEVDSFLQDRAHARQSWEVTMVNEMLTRMETYSGVFIASTNLMNGLDPAALRRFDLKVRFDFLLPDQAALLLARYSAGLGLAPATQTDLDRLRSLRNVTPGDFAAVVRQHRFRPVVSAAALVEALAQECSLKAPVSASIGFLR